MYGNGASISFLTRIMPWTCDLECAQEYLMWSETPLPLEKDKAVRLLLARTAKH
jgi:hypothetical protein